MSHNPQNGDADRNGDSSRSDDSAFERIRKAVEARDAFLREHPELQPLQDEITRLMRNMGSPHNRMALLDGMLRERVLELQRKLIELREALLARLAEAQAEAARAELEPGDSGKILGPADDWPIPDGLTGRDRPDRPPRGRPKR